MFIEINGIPTNVNTITNFKKTVESRSNADGSLQIYYVINYVKSNATVDVEQFTSESECNARYKEVCDLLLAKYSEDIISYISELQYKINDIDVCINKLVPVEQVVSETSEVSYDASTSTSEDTVNQSNTSEVNNEVAETVEENAEETTEAAVPETSEVTESSEESPAENT